MNRMNFLRRALQTKRHTILLCLLSLLWLQFSGVHLHSGHDGHEPHVHGSQSPHHADLDHDSIGADIDITPAAVLPVAWQNSDIGDVFVLTTVLLLFALAIAGPRYTAPQRQRRKHAAPFYLSPPLRAPPAQP